MQLKDYQQRSLDALGAYFRKTVEHDAKMAFMLATERPYKEIAGLAGMPYVCLRVPTGGGKTLMASHAVGLAARDYMQADRVVCLWLVPSNVIREQTLAALKNRAHPYRQALDTVFGGNVAVLDLADALYVTPATLNGATTILVSTLAALRVEETDGRKVYESNGNLQAHFVGLDDGLRGKLEKEGDGAVIYSLANVLRMRRPVVIMDEAHNARTPLSFGTLARFAPSCVIEFTATPETRHNPAMQVFASNVLHQVSARELKAAEMIKLPIKLRTDSDWKEVLGKALAKRSELEGIAAINEKETGEYLRPLLLIAAQPQNRNRPTLTVEVVKKALVEEFRVPEEQIAIATGQTRDLNDVDLFGRVPIRVIITVQALREGWDCSFAYVLCALGEQHSARSVEQILGRVLRMPRAKRKSAAALNVAYAFAVSSSFIATASTLGDALIENGFQELEARDFVVGQDAERPTFDEGLMFGTTSEPVTEAPDLNALDADLRNRVTYDASMRILTVTGILGSAEEMALAGCFTSAADREAVERLRLRSQGRPNAGQSENHREPLRVPLLAVRVGDLLESLDESHFLGAPWNLADCDHVLTEQELSSTWSSGNLGEIDITQAGRVELTHFVSELHEQMSLIAGESGWEVPGLVSWLDRSIRHPDIPQAQSSLFIQRLINDLMERRQVTVAQLARLKYRLRNAIEEKIGSHRDAHRKAGYQALLFGPGRESVEVDPSYCYEFDPECYEPSWYYEGNYRFKRSRVSCVGELKSDGEEFECAVQIDQLGEIDCWVRNLERKAETSFWLPTYTDRFYPDFVVWLRDGRVLVVEYKGLDRWTTDDSKEKRAVGALWEERSNGRCLFIMLTDRNWQPLIEKVQPRY